MENRLNHLKNNTIYKTKKDMGTLDIASPTESAGKRNV